MIGTPSAYVDVAKLEDRDSHGSCRAVSARLLRVFCLPSADGRPNAKYTELYGHRLELVADYERKALLNDLEAAGAIRIEKRRGEPFDFSVIIMNYNHPGFREVQPG